MDNSSIRVPIMDLEHYIKHHIGDQHDPKKAKVLIHNLRMLLEDVMEKAGYRVIEILVPYGFPQQYQHLGSVLSPSLLSESDISDLWNEFQETGNNEDFIGWLVQHENCLPWFPATYLYIGE